MRQSPETVRRMVHGKAGPLESDKLHTVQASTSPACRHHAQHWRLPDQQQARKEFLSEWLEAPGWSTKISLCMDAAPLEDP